MKKKKTKSGRPKSVFIFSILMILILAHIFYFIKHQNPVLSGLILSCSKFEGKILKFLISDVANMFSKDIKQTFQKSIFEVKLPSKPATVVSSVVTLYTKALTSKELN